MEEGTGSGKTNAALLLAYRLMGLEQADDLHMALPATTMANRTLQRLCKAARHPFASDASPSLVPPSPLVRG